MSSGYLPGVRVLKTDVSEHCVCSIFNTLSPVEDGTDSVPKRRLLILRRRGDNQEASCHYNNTAKA
jgi:hypothetical protein